LITRFAFTDKQATAVLDLRLYQLTGLEHDKIQSEYDELLKKIEYYRAVLASEQMVRDIIKEELTLVQSRHKAPRKTQIVAAEGDMAMEDLIANEPAMITISQDDYIKRMPIDTFREQKRGGQGVAGMQMKRQEDVLKGLYVADTHDTLLIFTNFGRVYWLKVWQIPETGRKSKGKPLVNLLEDIRPDEKIAAILRTPNFEGESCIVMTTKCGTVKKTTLDSFSNPRRKGIWALEIVEGDEMVAARHASKGQQIMLFTRNGMAVRFDEDKVRPMGRMARGVRGVALRDTDDAVVGMEVVDGDESVLIVCENGFGKRSAVEDFRKTNRGGVGVRSIITSDRNGPVIGVRTVMDADGIVMMTTGGQAVRISMRDVRVMGRATQGVKLANMKEGDHLVAVQKLENCDEASEEETEGQASEEKPAEVVEDQPKQEEQSEE